jgi:hypothetical protein
MRFTFAVAAMLIVAAIALAFGSRGRTIPSGTDC